MRFSEEVRKWFDRGEVDVSVPEEVREWFQSSLLENYRLFFSIAYGVLESSHDAEDAVQEAVLKAYRNLRVLEEPEKLVGWVARITRNTALDVAKKGGAMKTRLVSSEEHQHDVESVVAEPRHQEDFEVRLLILKEIGKLPAGQADVVLLKYLEDLDICEISERLGINANAAQVRLHRAYRAMSNSVELTRLVGVNP